MEPADIFRICWSCNGEAMALLTLLALTSKDAWLQIMYKGVDAVEIDMEPIKHYSETKLIYFISFLFVVSFYIINMFVVENLLLFLLFFIFAILGVELFGKLECSQEQSCSGLSNHANFKDFGIAPLTLFRVATGSNWNDIMKDTLRQDDSSVTEENKLTTMISPIYFITFVLITQLILVDIIIAVLLKNLEMINDYDVDAEMGEEIELQRQVDLHDRNNFEQ
ncbi:unnamed protein product [Rotaria sp. Silwood1]|nr:unnamed protein product [Rotaria sp. Silwood1]CAF1634646.1 unnamed protein product [Rotaria sp. Silwood1]